MSMTTFIIIFLVILWLGGFISIPSFSLLHYGLFYISGRAVTVWDIILLAVIIWMIGVLPYPFRGIGTIILILWFMSILGIIALHGFSNLILALIIIGLILHLLGITFQ